MSFIQLFISVVLIFFTLFSPSNQLSDKECLELGFRRSQLACSHCNEFPKFDLNPIKESCLKCCQKDLEQTSKKYSSARIEFCGCPTHASSFPQTDAFIRSDKIKKFPNLSVKTVKGSDPVIKLMDANGLVVDELSINKWDTDTIEDFLRQHLLKKK